MFSKKDDIIRCISNIGVDAVCYVVAFVLPDTFAVGFALQVISCISSIATDVIMLEKNNLIFI